MWTFTAYFLSQLMGTRETITLNEFADFMFNNLWQKHGIVFNDGSRDLYCDLKYLKELGILDLNECDDFTKVIIRVKDKEKLAKIAGMVVKNSNYYQKIFVGANFYYPLVYLPCPYAYWILYCPFRSTHKCKICTVKKEAERLREKAKQ
jgi:NACalpha-BTF3-like transcription factor